jgi:hypothetical protein
MPATISAQRKTEQAKLARLMRGELDWIVMRALEKDRVRRYDTANAPGDVAVVAVEFAIPTLSPRFSQPCYRGLVGAGACGKTCGSGTAR